CLSFLNIPRTPCYPLLPYTTLFRSPVSDQEQAEIVTKFYDYNAEQEDQESALVLYNNRYYQSTGVGIASPEGETFEVISALSGTDRKSTRLNSSHVSISYAVFCLKK